jgi:hypothetical protein
MVFCNLLLEEGLTEWIPPRAEARSSSVVVLELQKKESIAASFTSMFDLSK